MSGDHLLGVLRRRWVVILVVAVLGAAFGLLLTRYVTPVYTSTTKLYVSGVGTTASDRLQAGEYARTRVSSYADMIGSAELLDAVRAYLGLPLTGDSATGDVAAQISATNPLDTSVIDVSVRAASPRQAQEVATAVGSVADSVIGRLESPPDGRQSPVRIAVASAATLPLAKDSPSGKVYGAAGFAAGAVLGLGLGALLDRRRRTHALQPATGAAPTSWSWWPAGVGRTARTDRGEAA